MSRSREFRAALLGLLICIGLGVQSGHVPAEDRQEARENEPVLAI